MAQISEEMVESLIVEEVKFLNLTLKECRRRNEFLQQRLGSSYAKYIGLGTPYEEAIHSLRKVKGEMDGYLETVRSVLLGRLKRRQKRRK